MTAYYGDDTCSYEGCSNRYSLDSQLNFFKFPPAGSRRNTWIANCGNSELGQLSDRQLRGKRLCSEHFKKSSFNTGTSKKTLSDRAIPIKNLFGKELRVKKGDHADEGGAEQLAPHTVKKRGPGRPAKTQLVVNKEDGSCTTDVKKPQSMSPFHRRDSALARMKSGRELRRRTAGDVQGVLSNFSIQVIPILNKTKIDAGEANGRRGRGPRQHTKPETLIVKKTAGLEARVAKRKRSSLEPAYDDPAKRKKGETPASVLALDETSLKEGEAKLVLVGSGPIEETCEADEVLDSAIKTLHRNRKKSGGTSSTEPKSEDAKEQLIHDVKFENPTTTVPLALIGGNWKSERKRSSGNALTFEKLNATLKQKCIGVLNGWSVSGVLFDPIRKMKMMAITDIQVSPSGSLQIRKHVKLFEDLMVCVFINQEDVSSSFDEKVANETEAIQLVSRVSLSKICAGVKKFTAEDSAHHPVAVKKGDGWYSAECPIFVPDGGAYCGPCFRLRNALNRRKGRERKRQETFAAMTNMPGSSSSGQGEGVQSKLGKVLYDMLEALSESKPESAYLTVSTPCKLEKPENGDSEIKTPATSAFDKNAELETASASFLPSFHQIQIPHDSTSTLQNLEKSNDTTQSGHKLTVTLADGQKLELISETDFCAQPEPGITLQQFGDHLYEVVEVDDETMAQLTAAQTNSRGFPSDASDLQRTDINSFDPTNLHIIKFLTPSPVEFFTK